MSIVVMERAIRVAQRTHTTALVTAAILGILGCSVGMVLVMLANQGILALRIVV